MRDKRKKIHRKDAEARRKISASWRLGGESIIVEKRIIYRSIAVGLVIILAVVLFWIGKGHSFLFDNKEITLNGKTSPAHELVQVTIDKQKPIQVRSGMRKQTQNPVAGPWHTITVEIIENKAVTRTVTKKFSVNLAEMFVVNLPALLENEPQWMQEFVPNPN